MGSQAELLSKSLGIKRIGVDSILIWLVFSKVAYEFIHNYPFSIFSGFVNSEYINYLDEDVVNFLKNIGVLLFFLLLLVTMGFHQIRKYNRNERKFKDTVDQEVKDLLSPEDFVEQVKEPLHTTEIIDEQDNDNVEPYGEDKLTSESPENEDSEGFNS